MTVIDLLCEAQSMKASDLHITVGVPPKVRVHGNLVTLNYPSLTPQDAEELLLPILETRQKEIFDECGEVDFALNFGDRDRCRANVYRQKSMMAGAFRIINSKIPRTEDLGIPWSVTDLHTRNNGLVLVTGPTGSGKSTTLASIINLINKNRDCHIITLEDPIEYVHDHKRSIVNQREMGTDSKSYADALRAALREDPDVILVGEMRDLETISIAITAAETGHLVFSTLHTIGSAATIDRIIDVFPLSQQEQIRIQLSTVLQGVISQRLIPNAENNGRVAAFEVMLACPAIQNLIRENKTYQIQSVLQTNRQMGMQTLDNALFDLYVNGKIAKTEAIRYAIEPSAMEKALQTGGF
jgi:twitching motility protein PilT